MLHDPDVLFSMSGLLVMIGWLLLIASPKRWKWLLWGVGIGIPCVLSVLYGGLMMVNFATVDGGGYGSLGQVRALMQNDAVLLAGWVHYLAFDLAIGAFIAQKADAAGISRVIQIPILLLTFQFGPVGFLLFVLVDGGWRAVGGSSDHIRQEEIV